jgi:hypothetical protein
MGHKSAARTQRAAFFILPIIAANPRHAPTCLARWKVLPVVNCPVTDGWWNGVGLSVLSPVSGGLVFCSGISDQNHSKIDEVHQL